jgi:hypothetical protein
LWIGMMTALLALVAGCGGDENSSGEQDAALSDADLHDGSNDDASSDEDNDEDGYPASKDCDDFDSAIYPSIRGGLSHYRIATTSMPMAAKGSGAIPPRWLPMK